MGKERSYIVVTTDHPSTDPGNLVYRIFDAQPREYARRIRLKLLAQARVDVRLQSSSSGGHVIPPSLDSIGGERESLRPPEQE